MHHNKKNNRVEGSVPCGNPKRYGSRDVVHMQQAGSFGRKRRNSHEDASAATEGEKHIQTLLHHQTKIDVTIAEQFSQHRSFSLATSHDPGAEKLIGVHKYEKFKAVNDLDSRVDYLRHCGLNDEEITLKLMEEMKDKVPIITGGYGTDPQSKLQKFREIERKIQDKEEALKAPDTFKGALELSRQAIELEKSSSLRQGKEPSVMDIITIQKKFKVTHPDDPVNHIQEMLCDIEGRKEREPRRERRRRRKLERKLYYYSTFDINSGSGDHNADNIGDSSNADNLDGFSNDDNIGGSANAGNIDGSSTDDESGDLVQNSTDCKNNIKSSRSFSSENSEPITRTANVTNENSKFVECFQNHVNPDAICPDIPTSKCQSRNLSSVSETDVCTTAVKTINTQQIQFISMKDIARNRLSLESIRSMDKFQNYTEGEPNNVVYVKNLPTKTTEEGLVALFGSFQSEGKPQIVFKLLTGRMRGQAFITFPDETTATKAVKLVNGYVFQGRPMILSFGKKSQNV
uniref:RRM domain-containing protein n=1 Tax=Arion vulgaris TaxID=1028688 RepID=A0A0B6Z760_9EUPU